MTLITDLLSGDASLQDFYVADGVGGIIEADIAAWAEAQGVMRVGTYDPNNDGTVTGADLAKNAVNAYALEGYEASYFEPSLEPTVKNDLGAWSWSHGLGKAVYRPGVQIYEDSITVDTTVLLGRDPQVELEAATKQYVDSMVQGFYILAPVRVASTDNIVLISGYLTIDGVVLLDGNRVLLKDQTTASENGIYVVSNGLWGRSEDMKGSSDPEPSHGMYTFITEGNSNTNTGWVLTTADPIVIDTTDLEFTLFTSTTRDYFAGEGLNLSENTFSVEFGANTVAIFSSVPSTEEAEGNSLYVARVDHGHYHGQLSGQLLHNLSSSVAHGFMSSTDKIKIDAIELSDVNNQEAYSYITDGTHTFSASLVKDTFRVGGGLELNTNLALPLGGQKRVVIKPSLTLGEILVTSTVSGENGVSWVAPSVTIFDEFTDLSAHAGEGVLVDATGSFFEYYDVASVGNQNAFSFVTDLINTLTASSVTDTIHVGNGLNIAPIQGGGPYEVIGLTAASLTGQVLFSSIQGMEIVSNWATLDSTIISDIPSGYFNMSSGYIKGNPWSAPTSMGPPENLGYLEVIKIIKNENDSTVYTGTFEFPGNWGSTHTLVFVNGLLESHAEVIT